MESKVLIVEDSREVQENIAEILQLERYQVFTANDAITAMNIANQVKPDIIICDILTPEKRGFDVLKYVRSSPDIQSIPFVFVTSQTEKENIQKAQELGASGYIVKPFEGQVLIDRIKGFMQPGRRDVVGGRASNESTIHSSAANAQ